MASISDMFADLLTQGGATTPQITKALEPIANLRNAQPVPTAPLPAGATPQTDPTGGIGGTINELINDPTPPSGIAGAIDEAANAPPTGGVADAINDIVNRPQGDAPTFSFAEQPPTPEPPAGNADLIESLAASGEGLDPTQRFDPNALGDFSAVGKVAASEDPRSLERAPEPGSINAARDRGTAIQGALDARPARAGEVAPEAPPADTRALAEAFGVDPSSLASGILGDSTVDDVFGSTQLADIFGGVGDIGAEDRFKMSKQRELFGDPGVDILDSIAKADARTAQDLLRDPRTTLKGQEVSDVADLQDKIEAGLATPEEIEAFKEEFTQNEGSGGGLGTENSVLASTVRGVRDGKTDAATVRNLIETGAFTEEEYNEAVAASEVRAEDVAGAMDDFQNFAAAMRNGPGINATTVRKLAERYGISAEDAVRLANDPSNTELANSIL